MNRETNEENEKELQWNSSYPSIERHFWSLGLHASIKFQGLVTQKFRCTLLAVYPAVTFSAVTVCNRTSPQQSGLSIVPRPGN